MTSFPHAWFAFEKWACRLVSKVQTDVTHAAHHVQTDTRLLLARSQCVRKAVQQSLPMAVRQIERKFHNLDVREIATQIVELLAECLAIMLVTTGLGAVAGGVIGFFGGGGVGAVPGAVEGAALGAEVGNWILAALGLAALAEFIVKGLPEIGRTYLTGLREAWQAASPANPPWQQPHENTFAIHAAANILARGHVAMFVLLLMAVVAWLSKGRSMDELAESASAGRLGPKFGKWLLENEDKLKADPRLRPVRGGGSASVPAAEGPADRPVRPRRVRPAPEKSGAEPAKPAKSEPEMPPVMPRKKVPCFKPQKLPPGKFAKMDRQLGDQKDALNHMTVQEYLDGRKAYEADGRKGAAKAVRKARSKFRDNKIEQLSETYQAQGHDEVTAEALATKETGVIMRTLDALHAPDMVAGGRHDAISGLGDSQVNRTIGRQWNRGRTQGLSRVQQMDAAAQAVPEAKRSTTLMNVDLHRCP